MFLYVADSVVGMKIGFDLDEVLAGFIEQFLKYYNLGFKTDYKRENIRHYDLWKVFGVERNFMINLVYGFYKSSFFKNIKPIDGSIDGVEYLKGRGDLYIVTSRENVVRVDTIKWLDRYFSKHFKGIEFTDDNVIAGKSLKKSDICRMLRLDAMIEDRAEYADECAKEGIETLLMDCPWNREYKEAGKVKRVYNWNEIIRLF